MSQTGPLKTKIILISEQILYQNSHGLSHHYSPQPSLLVSKILEEFLLVSFNPLALLLVKSVIFLVTLGGSAHIPNVVIPQKSIKTNILCNNYIRKVIQN